MDKFWFTPDQTNWIF